MDQKGFNSNFQGGKIEQLDRTSSHTTVIPKMRLFFLLLALDLPAFAHELGPDLRKLPDTTIRLLIDLFKRDANRDGRITESKFNWPKVLFSSIDQNKDGYMTTNEIEFLL